MLKESGYSRSDLIFQLILAVIFLITILTAIDMKGMWFAYGIFIGSLILLFTFDFIGFLIGAEIMAVCSYGLIVFGDKSYFAAEAGIKYFIIQSFSTLIIIFAASLIYTVTSFMNYSDIYTAWAVTVVEADESIFHPKREFSWIEEYSPAGVLEVVKVAKVADNFHLLPEPTLMNVAAALILIGLFTKMGLAPFGFWVSDIYEGSSIQVTYFFSTYVKIVYILYLMFMSVVVIRTQYENYDTFMAVFAFFSIFMGIAAIYQETINRAMAYSSMGNTGLIFITWLSNTVIGGYTVLYFMLVYVLTLSLFFSVLFLVEPFTKNFRRVVDFMGVISVQKYLSFTATLAILSLIGFPPSVLFGGKFMVLVVVHQIKPVLFILFVQGVIWFFYLRFIKNISIYDKGPRLFNSLNYFFSVWVMFLLILVWCPFILKWFGIPDILMILALELMTIFDFTSFKITKICKPAEDHPDLYTKFVKQLGPLLKCNKYNKPL
jgi:NADH:ubiquinone oxidoreductase subunit 2 (subunit N)